ncbi:aminopeptidase P family N-terminal domain-containing protein [Akkermansiaceae bacterium]|nr:aminopeptidase P family N-terminal domain-containing protein [Akkermansiaceae bacterium]MDB4782304.1 aminopeptidase P family N-terminal domain-containing protein [bacterium]
MTSSNLFTLTEMQQRIACIREKMDSLNLGAVIACDASNVRYTTGFKGEPRSLLILPDTLILFTSFRTISWATYLKTLPKSPSHPA